MVPTNAGEGGPGTPGVYGQVTAALVEQEQHQEETPRKKYGMSFLCPFPAIRFLTIMLQAVIVSVVYDNMTIRFNYSTKKSFAHS